MASLEELNNLVQQLQKKVIENQQDILLVESNLATTKQELEQTKRELQETKLQQQNNLEAQIQRFDSLIDKLKNSEGKTLKFACGSTNPDDTDWQKDSDYTIFVDVDTSNAGFSDTPYYFTSLRAKYGHCNLTGITSIYHRNQGFRIHLSQSAGITVKDAKDLKFHIQWLAVGI